MPEEQDVHADHDGYQREHVKHDGCPVMAGIAATRAEAIRWSLDRIRERPAYRRLRELRSDADKLEHEF